MDRVNPWLMLTVDKLVAGVFTILAPWCRSVALLTLCFLPAGFMGGFCDAASNTLILLIWGKENGPYMQAFHCLFGVGCLIAPLIAEPFLLQQKSTNTTELELNDTGQSQNTSFSYDLSNSTRIANSFTESSDSLDESQVMYAYLIVGIIMLLSSCAMVAVFLAGNRKVLIKQEKICTQKKNINKNAYKSDMKLYVCVLVLLGLLLFVYVAMEVTYGTFLMTFAVKQLGWTKSQGAAVSSALMGAFTGGRALGIVLVIFIQPYVLLLVDLTLCVVFAVVLTAFSTAHSSVLWVCSVCLGLSMATVYATGFTWTECHLVINPRISSLILVASAIGEMSGPAITGPLMEKYTYMSYCYFTLGSAIACLGCMAALQVFGSRLKAVQLTNITTVDTGSRVESDEGEGEAHYLSQLNTATALPT